MKLDKVDKNLSLSGKFSKSRIAGYADSIMEKFEEGELDPLKAMIHLKAQKELLSIVESRLTPLAINEAEKYGVGDDKTVNGVAFSVVPGRKTFSYEHDEKWMDYEMQIKALKRLQKLREEEMEAAMKFSGAADENGEVVPVPELKKIGDSVLRCVIPK